MFYTPVPPFDASKTLWKPDFLASKGLVERPHPPLRRGDYMDRLGIYGWQNLPADFVPDSASSEKRQRAIEAMYYGLENEPPCSECLKRDRWCSRLLTEGDQSLACSNCYLYRLGPCSHSNGGRTNRPTAVCYLIDTFVLSEILDITGNKNSVRAKALTRDDNHGPRTPASE